MKLILLTLLLSLVEALAIAGDKPAPPTNWEVIKVDSSDDNLSPEAFVKLDSVPQRIDSLVPSYPQSEVDKGVGGKYWMKALVNKQGLVRKVTILKSEGGSYALAASALLAVRQYRFRPGLSAGKPQACWITFPITFALFTHKRDSIKADSLNAK